MAKVVKFHDDNIEEEQTINLDVSKNVLAKQRVQLPMYQVRQGIVNEILTHPVSVIVGETGSGKSTQLPQALLELAPKQNIVISQPRRVAAISLANRVAAEAGSDVGDKVGYNVRFDAKLSKNTRIRYVTDGMLLREFMLDPMLSKYTTVIVDEAHERTITSDLVLGLLKRLLAKRDGRKFRVIVMSATLDAQRFADFFGSDTTAKLYVPGRAFGVERFYTKQPITSLIDATAQTIIQINHGEPAGGDILVFLPGQDEIETVAEILKAHKPEKGAPRMKIVPLYASLPEADQQLAFAPVKNKERKVVLATNIAETSVTIPGVAYVVDSGIRKVRVHRSILGLESLLPAAISQASAAQRMGRAGRERSGKCWRLYTEDFYRNEMVTTTEPEISRVSLSMPVLLLKRIGVDDVINFPWVDKPSKVAIRNALLQLYTLKALDRSDNITPFGLEMATLPLDPALAAVLVSAYTEATPKIREATLDVAACLSVQDLLVTPSSSRREEVSERRQELFPASVQYGDLILVKLIWDAYHKVDKSDLKEWCWSIGVSLRSLRRVAQVRKQLVGYLETSTRNKSNNRETEDADQPFRMNNKIRFEDAKPQSTNDETSDSDSSSDSDLDESALNTSEYEQLIMTFLRGYISNTAIALPDRRFQTIMTQQPVSIHPGSALFGSRVEAIMYLEYVYTARGYARFVSPISIDWLRQLAPHLLAKAITTQEM